RTLGLRPMRIPGRPARPALTSPRHASDRDLTMTLTAPPTPTHAPAARRRSLVALLLTALSLIFSSAPARAQPFCEAGFLPTMGLPGPWGTVNTAASWDPDGPGPLEPQLVVAGSFTFAGSVPVTNVAIFDGAQWGPLGGSAAAGG